MDKLLIRSGASVGLSLLTATQWKKQKSAILAIEDESFVESIRDDEAALEKVAKSETGIFLIAWLTTKIDIVGYLAADLLEQFGRVIEIREDSHFGKGDTLYVESIAVSTAWRHKGVGTTLLSESIQLAIEQGYDRVTAHIRHDALRKLSGVSCETQKSFANWYGTGERFDYVALSVSP